MDIFGSGARARVKALEEALAAEQARTKELTLQIIALADLKAHRSLTPSEGRERLVPSRHAEIIKATDRPSPTAAIAAVRARMAGIVETH